MFGIQEELDVNGNGQIVLRVKGTKVMTLPHPDNGSVQFQGQIPPKGKDIYVKTDGDDVASGNSWQEALATITKAVSLVTDGAGDRILVGPGAYDETVNLDNTKNNLTIIGVGGRGSVFIEPTTAGAEGMQVKSSDVTLINIGVAGESTADYALNVNGNRPGGTGTKFGRRFRAYGCKFEMGEGTGPAVILNGTADYNVSDALFSDCEFAWAGYGIKFVESGYGAPTQVFLDSCRMYGITTSYLWDGDSSVGPENLIVKDSDFDAKGGTEPTTHLDLVVGNGIFSGNRFALLSNATAKLVIGADIQWVANATEGGWSTGRPS